MENVERLPPVMPPLACHYLPAALEPSSRTTTRRRCQLLRCIKMNKGAHFSHNPLCCYRIATSALNSATDSRIPHSPASASHSIPSPAPPSTRHTDIHQAKMPRLRHKMRSRMGSSKGRAIRPPSLSPSDLAQGDSSSPSTTALGTGRYPKTRSGRGQAQRAGLQHNEET